MKRRTAKILQIVNWVGMFILLGVCHKDKVLMYGVGAVAVIIHMVLNCFLCCPHCGAWPRKGSFFHEFCPRCGKSLGD